MIKYSVDQQVAVISWEMTSAPMNVLNDESIPQFEAALQQAYADESVKGIIITSAKPEFVAGADLKMILRNNDKDPAEMLKVSSELNRVFRSIETSGKPAVAAINGTALGGGYEICLACHHRIALNNGTSARPQTLIGLVEVTIGLLPGAGGTQRLPRMIGIQAALPLIVEGKKVGVQEAKSLGMIDDIADSPAEMLEKARAWIEANPKPLKPWDEVDRKTGKIVGKDNFKVPGGNIQSPVGAQTFAAGTAMLMDKTKGNYPAPLEIMACVYEGLQVNIDRALVIEARHFVKVATSKVAKNLIQTMFLGMNEANKGASRPKEQPRTDVKKLGILGAGMMGAGIAYVSAQAGIEVVLKDVSVEAAEKGKDYSRGLLKKGVERGKVDPLKVDGILNLIKPTADYADMQGCDLIIEAVFENRELKAQVTKEAEPMLAEGGVFGSNTSTLPISGLAQASANPENFIGIHFFSPVDKMMLVEIIRGKQTSDYALAVAIDYVRKIRKTPIVVNDSRGFYTSRCFGTYTAEGMELLKDGVNPILIENGGRDAGMPVGPLAVTDEVALDLVYKISGQSIKDGAIGEDDTGYQIAKKFVELGRLGKKAKAGFYDYPDGGNKQLWPGLGEIFPLSDQQPSLDEVKTRLLYRQAIEAVRCFEEGVVRTKLDADLGSILAWGFPAYTGGALSFVDLVSVDTFVNTLDRLADQYGERFRPTEKLRERAGAARVGVGLPSLL
ncbi:3-hydroxyacyl-CoA dehydrogenase NAD-binding domain-containing protein [Spirosoma soli]|uniref:3-hydroxyacyl-CoA dehydrogenase NAD-binding domain-containing protein n=1 Tax=Spirosoma soli TaxID=1770529 RepID=A0ABW5M3X0_9BACT